MPIQRIVACLLFASPFLAAPLHAQPAKQPPDIAATEPLRPEEQIKKIKLPPGFELQLVAADPDIRKPININFDAAGPIVGDRDDRISIPRQDGAGRRLPSRSSKISGPTAKLARSPRLPTSSTFRSAFCRLPTAPSFTASRTSIT